MLPERCKVSCRTLASLKLNQQPRWRVWAAGSQEEAKKSRYSKSIKTQPFSRYANCKKLLSTIELRPQCQNHRAIVDHTSGDSALSLLEEFLCPLRDQAITGSVCVCVCARVCHPTGDRGDWQPGRQRGYTYLAGVHVHMVQQSCPASLEGELVLVQPSSAISTEILKMPLEGCCLVTSSSSQA